MHELLLFLVLEVVAFLGMAAHWWKKHYRLQTASDFKEYLTAHPKSTRNAVMGTFATVVGFYMTGVADWAPQWFANAFMAGYGLDSVLNKTKENI